MWRPYTVSLVTVMNKAVLNACSVVGMMSFFSIAPVSGEELMTEYGPPATFNGQQARVYFKHKGSEIHALGVEVPAAMYEGAPFDPPTDGLNDVPVDADDPSKGVAWYCCGYEIVLELPQSALDMTAFRHVVLNWQPLGHIPPGIYDLPHTDFHFYFMSNEERQSIGRARDSKEMCMVPDPNPDLPPLPNPQTCEQFALTAAELPPDQMAPGYISLGATEPAMGNHLLDPASHEFHGQSFDHTFIYMANAGKLTGMEPMITLGYLRSLQAPNRVPISMPAAFPESGHYPTEYVMEYDREADVFRVVYENWKAFPASGGSSSSQSAGATP